MNSGAVTSTDGTLKFETCRAIPTSRARSSAVELAQTQLDPRALAQRPDRAARVCAKVNLGADRDEVGGACVVRLPGLWVAVTYEQVPVLARARLEPLASETFEQRAMIETEPKQPRRLLLGLGTLDNRRVGRQIEHELGLSGHQGRSRSSGLGREARAGPDKRPGTDTMNR